VEAVREDVEEEAAEEFVVLQGDALRAASAEGDPRVVDADEAGIGDGDAVGVASEVVEDVERGAEAALGVGVPAHRAQVAEAAGEV